MSEFYVVDFQYLPIIDCGELNETEFIVEPFVIVFESNKTLEELNKYFLENIESVKMNSFFNEGKYRFSRLYFMKSNEGTWNFKIKTLDDYKLDLIRNITEYDISN